MIDYVAQAVPSTSARARVHAFVSDARLVGGAIGTKHALRPTTGVRITEVLGNASAKAVVALSVRPAG